MENCALKYNGFLSLEGQRETKLVSVTAKTSGIKQSTKSDFHALTKHLGVSQAETPHIVDLGFQRCVTVERVLGAYFDRNCRVCRIVPRGFGPGFDLRVNLMVVRCREEREFVGTSIGC